MSNDKVRNLIRAAVLTVAVAMIVFGVTHGEVSIVLRKAVKVCLECIGLG